MDQRSLQFYLDKILPDVSPQFRENLMQISADDFDYYSKVQEELRLHFEQKLEENSPKNDAILNTETAYISKLFPTVTIQSIYEQLSIFKDLHNRKEIVCRILLNNSKIDHVIMTRFKRNYDHVTKLANADPPMKMTRRHDDAGKNMEEMDVQ